MVRAASEGRDLPLIIGFLSDPRHLPGSPPWVERIETHHSWVFLTPERVYKLKKLLAIKAPEAAILRKHAEREVQLNRRLAPQVYLGLIPICRSTAGELALGGHGRPVEWLVQMRRLPAEAMLDARIRARRLDASQLDRLGRYLSEFYRRLSPEPWSPDDYVCALQRRLTEDLAALLAPAHRYAPCLSGRFARCCGERLRARRRSLADRAASGHLVEGHGDLRPEHVCLTAPPSVIDCLDFDRNLRILDPVDELAYLGLECERLGHADIGPRLLRVYADYCRDPVSISLAQLYAMLRALTRARLAWQRIEEAPGSASGRWRLRTLAYLHLAARALDREASESAG
jgi:aminoglycoside phosphotransferase family enzyme